MTDQFDFIVIGGGSAGYAAARTASGLGLKVAVVEGGAEVGGLCILRGCMPSKTLLESAHRAETIRRAAEFGLRGQYRGADPLAIRDRKRRLVAEFADYRREQLENGTFEFIRGRASFSSEHTLEIALLGGGPRKISGRTFLIATGSTINFLEIPGLTETGYVTSDDVLDAATIPESIIILGGGAIGLEAATYFTGLGKRVSVIQRSAHVLKEMDTDVAAALTEAMQHRGVEVFTDTCLREVRRDGAQKLVEFMHRGETRTVCAEEILYALGRKPNLAGLALDRAAIATDGCMVLTNSSQQCTPTHVFAAGDVCGPHEIVHIAVEQGEIAARNAARLLGLLDGELEAIDFALKLFVVFTQPEVSAVGLTEREATAAGCDFVVAKYPFSDHGKALVIGEPHGFVKLIAERDSRRIIGAACVGPHASELIHEIVVAMHFRATAADLAKVPHYHPTLSEIWMYPAEELAG